MRPASLAFLLLALTACRLEHANSGRPPGPPTVADSLARVEQDSSLDADVQATLRMYFDRVSSRDWRGVRAMFANGAIVTTRAMPQGEKVDDYLKRPPDGTRNTLFSARMLHAHVTGYGNVADAWVIYENRSGQRRDSLSTSRGIAAFHLNRDRGSWRILSLAQEPEDARRPLVPPARRPRRTTARTAAPRSGT